MLPPQCRWLHRPGDTAYLHWHGACVAVVRVDGRVTLQGWGRHEDHPGRTQAHSMRMVERWVAHRQTWPGFDRAKVLARIERGREREVLAGRVLGMR